MIETPTLYPRVRSYYRSFAPLFRKPNVAAYTMLVLSFFTMTIFGIFAIRPTLSTIVQLKKRIDDQKTVYQRMDDKISQLRKAEVEYNNIRPDLEAIFASLPSKPETAALLGKVNNTLLQNNINVTVLQFSSIELSSKNATPSATPIAFSLTARASYDNLIAFVNILNSMDRIITIDSIDIAKNQDVAGGPQTLLSLTIRGKSYSFFEKKSKKDG